VDIVLPIGTFMQSGIVKVTIAAAHGVPRNVQKPSAVPNIVVKFANRSSRDSILAKGKSFYKSRKVPITANLIDLQLPGNNIYIQEHLCLEKKRLFHECRLLKKERLIQYVWIKNGKIMVRKADHCEAKEISLLSDVASFRA